MPTNEDTAPLEDTAPTLSDDDQARLRKAVPQSMLATPYLSSLHLAFERYDPDEVTLRLPFRAELTNDGT
jgi:hypothetical protein